MTLGERIAHIIKELNMTQNSFAKKLGYKSNVQIGEYVSGTKPGWEFFYKLTQAIPSANLEWVIAEKGLPFKEKHTAATNNDEAAVTKEKEELYKDLETFRSLAKEQSLVILSLTQAKAIEQG